jgi:hypothetical protein
MGKNKNRFEVAVIIAVFVAGASMFTASSTYNNANAQGSQQQKNVVRDSETTLLEGKAIPANDYIHLYDSTPYRITNGHVMRAIQVR